MWFLSNSGVICFVAFNYERIFFNVAAQPIYFYVYSVFIEKFLVKDMFGMSTMMVRQHAESHAHIHVCTWWMYTYIYIVFYVVITSDCERTAASHSLLQQRRHVRILFSIHSQYLSSCSLLFKSDRRFDECRIINCGVNQYGLSTNLVWKSISIHFVSPINSVVGLIAHCTIPCDCLFSIAYIEISSSYIDISKHNHIVDHVFSLIRSNGCMGGSYWTISLFSLNKNHEDALFSWSPAWLEGTWEEHT